MKKHIALLTLSLALSSCSLFQIQRMDVEQGNHISEAQVQQLHKGMSKAAVKAIMGSPVLINVFTPSHSVYIYTMQQGNEDMTEKQVVIDFNNGQVVNIQSTH